MSLIQITFEMGYKKWASVFTSYTYLVFTKCI